MDKEFLYQEIRTIIQKLTNKVECHRIMFNGNKEDFKILTEFNSNFFGFFQGILQQSIILDIGYLFDKRKETCSFKNLINSWSKNITIPDIQKKYLDLKKQIESLNLIECRHEIFAHRNAYAIQNGKFANTNKMSVSHFEIGLKKIHSFFYEFENAIYNKSDKLVVSFDIKNIQINIYEMINKLYINFGEKKNEKKNI